MLYFFVDEEKCVYYSKVEAYALEWKMRKKEKMTGVEKGFLQMLIFLPC